MNLTAISPSKLDAAHVPVEELATDKNLTNQQKVAEASRQFEAILLQQILSETQKPVITSEFTDNSTASGIYQDYITKTLADSMSKSGTLGLAKVFEQQLTHPAPKQAQPAVTHQTQLPARNVTHLPKPLSITEHE